MNAANRLLGDDQFSYSYDANGNLTSKTDLVTLDTTTYSYDAQDQLVRIDFPDSSVATYAYDGHGRRIEKDVAGVVTRYLYDDDNIVMEFDATNTLTARYSHGDQVDQPLVLERGGQSYFYHRDFLGSIRSLTDAAGVVVNEYDYDAYGNFETRAETVPNPYTFTAREFDPENGLHYYRARYYDANAGRFISEDPIRFESNDLTLYRYALNNPVMLTDPDGLVSFSEYTAALKARILAIQASFVAGVAEGLTSQTSAAISVGRLENAARAAGQFVGIVQGFVKGQFGIPC